MDLLIVESPAKAKTLGKYLGKDFQVLSSYGHVRALPSETGSVKPEEDFTMQYEVLDKATRHVDSIVKTVKKAENIYLATDPDREGEAISWHIAEILRLKKAIPSKDKMKRIVFHEITKKAVLDALTHARDIDMNLVNAQQARLALDYLVGFTLSPILWRKLPGSRSAGRVQSVALRLVVEREEEIEKFKTQEYWDIEGDFKNTKGASFQATLTHYKKEKLEKFSIPNEATANDIVKELENRKYSITAIEKKKAARNPSPPFTTSTLIQEAARKFGFSAKKTAQVAQKLYEGVEINGEATGLITYMRTDSVNLSSDAVASIRQKIEKDFSSKYLPDSPRMYKTKSKNAQEAHEAIRPTNIFLAPQDIRKFLEDDFYKLYELIWRRTMACQMKGAELDVTTATIEDEDKMAAFRATGSIIVFDGFYKIYKESKDDEEDEQGKLLPPLEKGELTELIKLAGEQHFTQPPPRFTEASLVKKLEELGIGRPSTYPAILSILQERKYVKLEKKRFFPEARGRIVNAFLVLYFKKYVEYNFTATLEDSLDDVANGEKTWKAILKDFWQDFKPATEDVGKIKNQDIVVNLEQYLKSFLFKDTNEDNGTCPKCNTGKLNLRLGSFGAFIGCTHYPNCDYISNLTEVATESEEVAKPVTGEYPKVIGKDPNSGQDIQLKKGPYGLYLQIGPDSEKKRVSIPKNFTLEQVNQQVAEFLFSLPKLLGKHPETNEDIKIGIGKFGPYIQYGKNYASIKRGDLINIDLPIALEIIEENQRKPKTVKKK
jgi:DNA topoisomerase-1